MGVRAWNQHGLGFPAEKWKVRVAQSCPTLRGPVGILQARTLEWEPLPSPGDLPNPGTEPRSPSLQADSLPAEPQGKPSLLAQWYKYIPLCRPPCQCRKHRLDPRAGKIPHATEQLSSCATATQPELYSRGAATTEPTTTEACTS